MAKNIYRTMQGREIDMDALMAKNETMPAVGNVKVNARGDELGPGGKIVRKREEIVAAYYEDNPNAIPQQGIQPQKTQQPEAPSAKSTIEKVKEGKKHDKSNG